MTSVNQLIAYYTSNITTLENLLTELNQLRRRGCPYIRRYAFIQWVIRDNRYGYSIIPVYCRTLRAFMHPEASTPTRFYAQWAGAIISGTYDFLRSLVCNEENGTRLCRCATIVTFISLLRNTTGLWIETSRGIGQVRRWGRYEENSWGDNYVSGQYNRTQITCRPPIMSQDALLCLRQFCGQYLDYDVLGLILQFSNRICVQQFSYQI
uniref:Uncharacterized protein n=1 Tax=viral metagenome TaxID=1070528 RepID=A0A6C0CD06_9ZZZZ